MSMKAIVLLKVSIFMDIGPVRPRKDTCFAISYISGVDERSAGGEKNIIRLASCARLPQQVEGRMDRHVLNPYLVWCNRAEAEVGVRGRGWVRWDWPRERDGYLFALLSMRSRRWGLVR